MAPLATSASNARPPATAHSRRSVFLEAPMDEYTPAHSIYESPAPGGGGGRGWRDMYGGKSVLRVANGLAHAVACSLLLWIMGEFLQRYQGNKQRPQAIVLIVLVAVDLGLDVYCVCRLGRKWQAWALLARLVSALGYIAMFLVYVGFREVFPRGYSYWAMAPGFSDPIVYLFLWVLGIWDLVHTTIHRHSLGRDLRRNMSVSLRRRDPTVSGTPQGLGRLSAPDTLVSHQRTPSRLGRGPEAEAIISLDKIQEEEKSSVQVHVMKSSGASVTSGESSS